MGPQEDVEVRVGPQEDVELRVGPQENVELRVGPQEDVEVRVGPPDSPSGQGSAAPHGRPPLQTIGSPYLRTFSDAN